MIKAGTVLVCRCGVDLFTFTRDTLGVEKVRTTLANGAVVPIAPQTAPVANACYCCHNCGRPLTPADVARLERREGKT